MSMFKYKQDNKVYLLKKIPNTFIVSNSGINKMIIGNREIETFCIKCRNPVCISFDETEYTIDALRDFPASRDNYVCVVNAIEKDKINNSIVIDKKKCIKCRMCMTRCPVHAIYSDTKGNIQINTRMNDELIQMEGDALSAIKKHMKQLSEIKNVSLENEPVVESDAMIAYLVKKLKKIDFNKRNIFVRNLLICLGCKAVTTRIGDTNNRMDVIYATTDLKKKIIGTIEAEFGTDCLSVSRDLLDDIAMLQYKYGIKKEKDTPFAVFLTLPTRRQDFWNVIKDVETVTNIKINTTTIPVLLILLWNGKKFIDVIKSDFFLHTDKISLRNAAERILGRKVNLSMNKNGILEPK